MQDASLHCSVERQKGRLTFISAGASWHVVEPLAMKPFTAHLMSEVKRSERGRAQQADGSDSQQSPDGAPARAGQMRGFGMRRRAVGIAGLCLH